MTEFKYKRFNYVYWFSPPYFTHVSGYKIYFEVDISHKTSLCIYSYMMLGPCYDHLQWPFKGQIIIQILIQCDDHHHYDYVINKGDNNHQHNLWTRREWSIISDYMTSIKSTRLEC